MFRKLAILAMTLLIPLVGLILVDTQMQPEVSQTEDFLRDVRTDPKGALERYTGLATDGFPH
jgi:hypothetical protein